MQKKVKYLFSILIMILFFSCSKSSDNDLPSLADEDDVCTAMDDSKFMKWCYENYDVNGDGKVSKIEAAAVREFKVGSSKSFSSVKGLEYFTGVEYLDIGGTFTDLELRHMPNLKTLSITSAVNIFDLRNNSFLTKIKLTNVNVMKVLGNDINKIIAENPFSKIIGFEKLSNPEISLWGVFYFDELDLANIEIQHSGLLIVKNLTISIRENNRYSSNGMDEDVIFNGDTYHHYKNHNVLWQTINPIKPINNSESLEGTWAGNMYISSSLDGRNYDATSTEVTFLRDPFTYTTGSGYWVDYYSGAPWNYVAFHIDWSVNNDVIRIYFREEGTRIEIRNYRLNNDNFVGTMYDSGKLVDFELYNVYHPFSYWDDYRWGYDSWYNYYSYLARTRTSIDETNKEKNIPIRLIHK